LDNALFGFFLETLHLSKPSRSSRTTSSREEKLTLLADLEDSTKMLIYLKMEALLETRERDAWTFLLKKKRTLDLSGVSLEEMSLVLLFVETFSLLL